MPKHDAIEGWDVERADEDGEPTWTLTKDGRRVLVRFSADADDEGFMARQAAITALNADVVHTTAAGEDPSAFRARLHEIEDEIDDERAQRNTRIRREARRAARGEE